MGFVVTVKKNWILTTHALHGNPVDGKTLKEGVAKAEANIGVGIDTALVGKGYRWKKHHQDRVEVFISGRKRLPIGMKRLLKRTSAVNLSSGTRSMTSE